MKVFCVLATFICVELLQIHFAESLEASIAGRLPNGRAGPVAVHDRENSAYIIGGYNGTVEVTDIFRFDIPSGSVENVASLPVGLGYGSANIDSDGNLFYFGGFGSQTYYSQIWMVPVGTSEVVHIGDLPNPSAQHSSTYDDEEFVYIYGGQAGLIAYSYIIKFSTKTYELEVVSQMGGNLNAASVAWNGDSAFLFGGVTSSYFTNLIRQYTPGTNTFTELDVVLSTPLINTAAASAGKDTYVVGGTPAFGTLHQITKFDTSSHLMETYNVTNLPEYLDSASAVYDVSTNSIYTFGGSDRTRLLDEIFVIPLGEK